MTSDRETNKIALQRLACPHPKTRFRMTHSESKTVEEYCLDCGHVLQVMTTKDSAGMWEILGGGR